MNLKQKYTRQDFLEFLKRFLPDFKEDPRPFKSNSLQIAKEVFFLGESTALNLQIFELSHPGSSEARMKLAADGFKIMKESATYNALIAYRSKDSDDWRLSLLTANPEVDEKGGIVKKLSNPRRYSFFLGPNAKTHTPEVALKDKVKDFDDFKNRFSIEVVNKDFYAQVARLFTKLAGGKRGEGKTAFDAGKGCLNLVGVNDDGSRKEFSVRLVGRLVFCWFLKKKSSKIGRTLLSDKVLSSAAVEENKNFYHQILEPLFFQVLNEPVESRQKEYRLPPWSDTPFLNGGLFGPHENDYYEPGPMGISKHINTLKIPDEWFAELFKVFELYNFTIDENTSVDVELSVEPEMLGRIFENLLAEINPETGETARKSTGSYYTPRPIVEYMVDESLKQYLASKTEISEQKLAALLAYDYESGETGLSKIEMEAVIKALDNVKIIDPACGSGAFPMGVLQKMLLILQKVDPRSNKWLERQLAKIENGFYKKEFEKKLRSENVSYVHKLGIIQNSIYGVDIQPIAIEISKLRFFLSLIVDENVDDSRGNRGVQPLPNLEFKFVCANSLNRLPKLKRDNELFVVEDHESIEKLKNLRENYLNSSGKEKESIKLEFQRTQSAMMDFYFKSFKKQGDLFGNKKEIKKQQDAISTQLLGSWEPFSDKTCEWFDSEWMFGIADGFDIVIANPPYKGFRDLDKQIKESLQKIYVSAEGKFDLYIPFIEQGFFLLREKGCLVFICPTNFTKRGHAEGIRKFLLENSSIKEIIDFGHDQIFDQVTNYTGIFLFTKGISKRNEFTYRSGFSNEHLIVKQDELTIQSWIFTDKSSHNLIDKISQNTPLDQITKISEGIVTGLNALYLKRRDEIENHKFEKKYFFPCLRGKEIGRYFLKPNIEYVFYPYFLKDGKTSLIEEDILKKDCSKYLSYLKSNLQLIQKRGYFLKSSKQWYELWNQRDLKNFSAEKIITPELSDCNRFMIADGKYFYGDTVCGIILRNEFRKDFDLRYLLAILNSQLIEWFYKKTTVPKAGGFFIYKVMYLGNIPIKKISLADQKPFVECVSKILSITSGDRYVLHGDSVLNKQVSELENLLNQMVCKLYGLTKDEIKLVQNEFGEKESKLVEILQA